MGQDFPLNVGQKRLAALTRRTLAEVVRAKSLEIRGAFGPCQLDLGAAAEIGHARPAGQRGVLPSPVAEVERRGAAFTSVPLSSFPAGSSGFEVREKIVVRVAHSSPAVATA
jgi:hypothetical protein